MQLAPAGVPLSFEVTYDSAILDVGMTVYDDSGASPVLVAGPSAMARVAHNTYRAKFTADDGKSYIIIKAVYTDDTFDELDPNYSQGSESIIAQYVNAPANPQTVVGIVENNDAVVGVVDC